MMQQRIAWLDTAKGLAIMLVVLGHVSFLPAPVLGVIYAFHMPLFFFLSGILLFRKREPFVPFLKKKVRTLIVPYYLFLLLQVAVLAPTAALGFHHAGAYLPGVGALAGGSELWFLFALFFVEMLLFLPAQWLSREQLAIGGGIILALAIVAFRHNDVTGAVPFDGTHGSTLPYSLDILFLGGFFVVLGMAIGRWLLERKIPVWVAVLALAVAVVCGVMNYHICGSYHVEIIESFIGNPVLFLLTASGAILCFVAICQRLPDGRLLGWCGRLSLAIYAVHWIVVPFVDAPIYNYMLPLVQDVGLGTVAPSLGSGFFLQSLVPFLWRFLCGLTAFALITILTLPVVRVIEKWCPWMMGKWRVAAK